jgi:hypothetical protein
MMLTAALLAATLAQPYPYPPYPPPPPEYPPPAYAPPPRHRQPQYQQPQQQPRGMVGLVLMPIGSATLSSDEQATTYASEVHGALALEVRSPYYGPLSGARLRFVGELSDHDRVVEAGFKYNFFDPLPVQPFIALGLGAARLGPEVDWRASFSGSIGLDLFLTPNFFLSAELKGRSFADPPASSLTAVYGNGVSQGIALFGLGAFF